ncbi:MAG: hypothetical protein AAGD18_15480 [Actinomycetota bacterium]
MVSITNRDERIVESRRKILPPFAVEPSLCLYSPQDNVDALHHPEVADWLEFVRHTYEPLPTSLRRVLLFLPCTATKPYVASVEHQAINGRLFAEGFEPVAGSPTVLDELGTRFPDVDPRLLDLGPLRRGDVEIARVVMSEPLAFVPYEHLVTAPGGGPSPATRYDDPGLFENRGNAVSPWRADSTAEEVGVGRWRWGANERRAYVEMHGEMAVAVADVLRRLDGAYDEVLAWVAPGLTHRSFCLARDERSEHGIAASKLVDGRRLPLVGVNDLVDPEQRIEVLPDVESCDDARARLAGRLGVSVSAANAVYARGGGGATPLALPELLDHLIVRLDEIAAVRV